MTAFLRKKDTENKKAKKTGKALLLEYAEAIITALVLALLIRAYLVQAFKIPTGSMKDTLLIGDHLLVNKFTYGTKLPFSDKKVLIFNDPEKGDIIVFKYPVEPERDFIKRIIAVGGDELKLVNKVIYVNGKKVDEPFTRYVDDSVRPPDVDPRDNFGPVTVPEGKYFMMGDNRDQSYDSRYWGFVDRDAIRGRAMIVYWSWDGEKKMPRLGRIGRIVHDAS